MMQAVFALTFSYNVALAAIILVVPLYLNAQGVSAAILGLAASLPAMVGLVLRLPSGVLSDRVGERAVLIGSNLAMGAAAALLWLAPGAGGASMPLVVGALLLSGVSRAVYWPCAQSYVSRVARGDSARTFGLFTSVGHFGQIIGTPICGGLLAAWGYGAGFALIFAGAVSGLAASLLLRPPVDDRPARGLAGLASPLKGLGASLLELARSRKMLFSGLCMAGAAVATALAGSFYPVYLADLGMRADAIGWLSSCRAVAAMASSLTMGLVGARLATQWAWLLGAGLAGIGIVVTPLLTSFVGLAAATTLIGASGGILQVVAIDVAAKGSRPENRAKAMAFTGLFYSVSLWAIPLALGVIAQATGITTGFALLGALWLALAVGVTGPARRMFRPGGPQ